MTTNRPLELLHMDLFGPIAYISIGGSKYCLVIVDDYSRFTMGRSSRILKLKDFLRRRASSMSSLLPTLPNKMV
jgi:hypothetical protein